MYPMLISDPRASAPLADANLSQSKVDRLVSSTERAGLLAVENDTIKWTQ